MHPNEKGRFCDQCKKTVIDFSGMSEEAVQHYFTAHWGEAVCGRFKHTQLQTITIYVPGSSFNQQMPVWQKLLLACLVIFGTALFPFETALGNQAPPTEESAKKTKKTGKKKQPVKIRQKKSGKCNNDFNLNESHVLGYTSPVRLKTPELVTNDTSKNNNHIDTTVTSSLSTQHSDKKQEPPASPFSAEALMPVAFAGRRKKKNS